MSPPIPTKVFRMSANRSRLVATIMVLLLTASAVIIASPATGQAGETLPTKPTVRLEPISSIRQFFYMRLGDTSAPAGGVGAPAPDCTGARTFISLDPATGSGPNSDQGRSCQFGTTDPLPRSVTFSAPDTLIPKRRVSFTGNDSFIYHHRGSITAGVTLDVEVITGDNTVIARGSLTCTPATAASTCSPGSKNLSLVGTGATTGRVEMLDNRTFKVTVAGRSDAGGTVPLSPAQWTIDDTNTRLEIRADNAIRAATWVTDEKDVLRDVFSPVANESNLPADRDRRFVGHFALESAFGFADASRGDAPRFTVLFDGRPREVAAGGQTILTGFLNDSASVRPSGVAVWSFPLGTVNYRGFVPGVYTVHVDKTHHQLGPINRAIERSFAITAQGVTLAPFSDPRTPGIAETQAHTIQPGSSTTYILAVNNTGAVNDTFTINLTAPNAPSGWGAAIGGPDVQSRRIFVPAHETRVFTVTVNAPIGGTGEIIHLVNVTSTVDPGTRSRDLTLVTRVSTEVVREVGVIILARDLTVEPGVETHFPIYVWNRGTRAQNVSLEIRETAIAGWTTDLAFGSGGADRIVIGAIQPGDISEATLKITGPLSAANPRHDLTLNATSVDTAGVSAERLLSFTLRAVSGVSVQILNDVGGREHRAELSGSDADPSAPGYPSPFCGDDGPLGVDCADDGVDGVWFRAWITNTGRLTDTFQLTADSFRKPCGDDSAWIPGTGADAMSGDFKFYVRSPSGVHSERTAIEALLPGKTAEFYVFLPVNRFADQCNNDEYSFIVQARGSGTGAIGRASAKAVAVNTARPHNAGVHLEGVVRESGYGPASPLVDIQNATKRTIVGAIEPGKNTTFFVRMSNLASWAAYTEDSRRRAPDLHVYMVGVDYEGGWNVSIRPVLDAASNSLQVNPYVAEYNLTNEMPAAATSMRRQGWLDRELEVVVQAPTPENGTVLAGTRHEFALIAEGANGTGDQSTLEIATIVTELANVTARSDAPRIRAHAGDEGAFQLYIANNGSSPTTVTLRASMAPETPSAGAWQVSPNAQTFPLAAFKNRSVALIVRPPSGASPGTSGDVNVTVEYARNPIFPTQTTNITMRLSVDVAGTGNLQLTSASTAAVIGPNGTATFPMTLRNTGSLAMPFRATATPIPNWTTVDVSPASGTINPGSNQTLTLVMRAPADVVTGTSFSSVVRVEETGAGVTDNFDTLAFSVNILGGQALPRLSVPNLIKRVDRAGVQNFEVQVQNVGNAAGRFTLETRSQDPSWLVSATTPAGQNITSVQVGVNELVNILVQVRAPFTVPERTVVPVEITAYSPDETQSAKATLSAEIHDYGVQLTLTPSTKDGLPGAPTEYLARLRNTGNDNDTLNLSVNLVDLPEWSVRLSSEEVRLEPNQEIEIRATLLSPTDPLPASRTYTFPFWVGTRGGQAVNISKNMTVSAVLTIPNYRAYDLDRDGQLELAIDLDKRAGNGFEEFREIASGGVATQVVAKPIFEGRTTFFLDIPQPYDGVADVWFNPETVHSFEIEHSPDINGDGTPDYLLDTDRDAKIDKAFDSATERFWDVFEIKVFGDERIQYVVDITGDGRPDRFYDPESNKVTRTQNADDVGADLVGIDVDDDERVDYYYNTRTKETSGAEVQNLGGFFLRFWYFFVIFAVLVLVTVLLLVRRKKAPPAP